MTTATTYANFINAVKQSIPASKNLILMHVKKQYEFLSDFEKNKATVKAFELANKKCNFGFEIEEHDFQSCSLGWTLGPIVMKFYGNDRRYKNPTLNAAGSAAMRKAKDDLFFDVILQSRCLFEKAVIVVLTDMVKFDEVNNSSFPRTIEAAKKKLAEAKKFFKEQEENFQAACDAAAESSI